MFEQRRFSRQKTLYGAQISADRLTGWSVDCTVRDLGPGGARIALSPRSTIPDTFKLEIPSKAAESAARLVWHRDGIIGVAFDASEPTIGVVATGTSDVAPTPLERRIAAIVGRAPNVIAFERRAR